MSYHNNGGLWITLWITSRIASHTRTRAKTGPKTLCLSLCLTVVERAWGEDGPELHEGLGQSSYGGSLSSQAHQPKVLTWVSCVSSAISCHE